MVDVAVPPQSSKALEFGAIFLVFPTLFAVGAYIDNYAFIYVSLVVFMFVASTLVENYLKIAVLFLTFYLSIGLLNISTWRGYTTVGTLHLYAWSMFLLVWPILLTARRRIPVPFQYARQNNFVKLVIAAHIAITFLSVLFVYGTIGNVLTGQHLRFRIPTAVEYTIKSGLPIAGVLPFLRLKWSGLWLIAILLPPILIGSRGTAVIGILAYLIVLLHKNGDKLNLRTLIVKNKSYLFYGAGAIGIISVLFYLRRGGDSGFAAVDIIMDYYFDYDNIFVRTILPFYLGFKETIGLSTLIITDNMQNTINPYPLFFADLFTILPGENLAAGQSMSRVFGSQQAGGLTPGMLGGLYIDYGNMSLAAFFFMGSFLAWVHRSSRDSPYFMIIYAQVLTQFVHLFHRGFLKPEYVTSILIAFFYFLICHRVHLNR